MVTLAGHGQLVLGNAVLSQYARSAPSGEWTPADLGSKLKLWNRSDDISGGNGDPKNVWTNYALASSWATNATASYLPVVTNSSLFGNRNVLWFTSDYLTYTNAGEPVLATSSAMSNCSIVVVFASDDSALGRTPFFISKGNASASSRCYVVLDTTTDGFKGGGRILDADSFEATSSASALPATIPFIGQADFIFTDGDVVLYTNNIVAVNDTSWHDASAGMSQTNSSLNFTIGCAWNTEFLAGQVGEILFVVPQLTPPERTNTYTYLKNKFGL